MEISTNVRKCALDIFHDVTTEATSEGGTEKKFADRMKNVKAKSNRLEKARRSLSAKTFFERPPKIKEGYDRLWVAAVDNVSYQPLIGNLRDYGIEFADNFGW